jgi:hypothetical protein
MILKLGKTPAKYDGRTLKLSSYLDVPKLPPLPPAGSDWFKRVSRFNMAGNDTYGDCVIAGAAHMRQTWTANAGKEIITPDKTVVKQYLSLTGGQDTGLNMLAVLNYWRQHGLFGNKIGAFVSVNPRKVTQMAYANFLFGGIYLGLELPLAWQDAKIWDAGPNGPVGDYEPGSLGGHCVAAGKATLAGYVVSTWGMEMQVTPAGMMYADEAYAVLSLDWFTATHKTIHGFAWKDLKSDLSRIAG